MIGDVGSDSAAAAVAELFAVVDFDFEMNAAAAVAGAHVVVGVETVAV